jgi:hypothetical protein
MHVELIVLAGTVASGFLFLSITRGLKMRDEKRPLAEYLWYGTGLLPLAGVSLFWASMGDQPVLAQRIVMFTIGATIGGCLLLAAGEWMRPAPAQAQASETPPMSNGPTINTWNQSGGQNTINAGPVRLVFDATIAQELVSKLPAGKPIMLMSVGSLADQAVAIQYQQYLQERGFQVERMSTGVLSPPPSHKIEIGDTTAAQVSVVIAPSAN